MGIPLELTCGCDCSPLTFEFPSAYPMTPTEPVTTELVVRYELAANAPEGIPVRALADSLTGLADVFEDANMGLGGRKGRVDVEFRASNRGSIECVLAVIESGRLIAMGTTELVPYVKLVMERVAGPDGVIATIAACRKHGISRPEEVKPGMVIENRSGKVQLSEEVAKTALEKSTQEDVWKFLDPLTSNVEAVTLLHEDEVYQRVEKEDLEYYRPIDEPQETQDTDERVTLIVAGLHFEGKNQWRLRDIRSDSTIRCKMSDPQFIDAVRAGLTFAHGYLIDVRMQTTVDKVNSSSPPTREITHVYSLRDPQRIDEPLYSKPDEGISPRLV